MKKTLPTYPFYLSLNFHFLGGSFDDVVPFELINKSKVKKISSWRSGWGISYNPVLGFSRQLCHLRNSIKDVSALNVYLKKHCVNSILEVAAYLYNRNNRIHRLNFSHDVITLFDAYHIDLSLDYYFDSFDSCDPDNPYVDSEFFDGRVGTTVKVCYSFWGTKEQYDELKNDQQIPRCKLRYVNGRLKILFSFSDVKNIDGSLFNDFIRYFCRKSESEENGGIFPLKGLSVSVTCYLGKYKDPFFDIPHLFWHFLNKNNGKLIILLIEPKDSVQ
jgi:hypothetical protein